MASELIKLEVLPLSQREQWVAERDHAIALCKQIHVVENQSDLDDSALYYKECTALIKSLREIRLDTTRPIDKLKKRITDEEKSLVKVLQEESVRLKGLNDAFAKREALKVQEEHRKRREEERKRAEALIAKQEADQAAEQSSVAELFGTGATLLPDPVEVPAPVIAETLTTKQEKVQTQHTRTVVRWKFAIVDAKQVPREFLSVDESKIRAFMQAQIKLETEPALPGVAFEKTYSVE